jgi:hypothetical protein
MLPQELHARRPYHLDDMQRARQRNPSNSSVKAKQTLDFSRGNKAVWSAMLEVLLVGASINHMPLSKLGHAATRNSYYFTQSIGVILTVCKWEAKKKTKCPDARVKVLPTAS